MKDGILLLNLGTPDDPEPEAVARYLKQFLMDKYVIDIAYPLRWFLVNVLIIPKRKFETSKLYKSIWTKRGSPLLIHLEDLAAKVVSRVNGSREVGMAMRYGQPSIEKGLRSLVNRGVNGTITVLPLYPQYAESSTRSSIDECRRVAKEMGLKAQLKFVKDFYDDPQYINAYAKKIKELWDKEKPDHLLMSFHGLPERHVEKTDLSGGHHCLKSPDCCLEIKDANRDCYRAQSYATARLIAMKAGIAPGQYTVSFQSRLGRAEWIKPYTDVVIRELAEKGVRTLQAACPSFAADCLETLEENCIRGAELFHEHGGKKYVPVDCLNSDDAWADAVVSLVSK